MKRQYKGCGINYMQIICKVWALGLLSRKVTTFLNPHPQTDREEREGAVNAVILEALPLTQQEGGINRKVCDFYRIMSL